MRSSKPTHGGKRKGAGRKPASLPSRLKKLRASEEEWNIFRAMLTGDARKDFLILLEAVNLYHELNQEIRDEKNDR